MDNNNKYALYTIEGKEKEQSQATEKIDKAIDLFGEMIRQITIANPDLGIGDTETDELITDDVYSEIHGGR